ASAATFLSGAIASGGATAHQAWAQVAQVVGAPRAAYLLHPDTTQPPRQLAWQRPAVARCLPDRWLVVAYGPNLIPLGAALSKAVTGPLHVGPDPQAHAQVLPSGVLLDPGLAWLGDFNAAVDAGMAVRLLLDAGVAVVTATVKRLLVVGLHTGDAS